MRLARGVFASSHRRTGRDSSLWRLRHWRKCAPGSRRPTTICGGAEIDLGADPPLTEDALFHCQQAVEKAMKGFLTAHERIFRTTHDLDELGRSCMVIDPTISPLVDMARDLTVFAWEFRYPGATEVPSAEEVHRALTTARSVSSQLLSPLPAGARP